MKEELAQRFASTDARITEVRADLNARITEVKTDLLAATNRVGVDGQSSATKLEARIDANRESYAQELRALKEDILRAMPGRDTVFISLSDT